MFLRQLDLTTALRPNLYDDESLLFVAERVGLYEGKYKIEKYQNGSAYLTSHRICYVDNEDPRTFSVAVELKEIERIEFAPGFVVKSSPKITLFPKPLRKLAKSPLPRYASPSDAAVMQNKTNSRSISQSPAPARDVNATWVCPICGLSNAVPANFDPSTANQHTQLPPCQACGIPPTLVLVTKAAIAAVSNRASGATPAPPLSNRNSLGPESFPGNGAFVSAEPSYGGSTTCPRCTFQNHPSLNQCEICGASLTTSANIPSHVLEPETRSESPGPSTAGSIIGDDTIETIKFSFRGGGEKTFLDRLKSALQQRKWLLQSAPPIPRPAPSSTPRNDSAWPAPNGTPRTNTPPQRIVGIAGLELRREQLRKDNEVVIGSAFDDLEALMTSAKEVIAMAERFAKQNDQGGTAEDMEARTMISDSAAALGLVTTRDMLGSGSASETLYVTELSRNLAEFLTDDRKGILRKEGGIMSLVDLWSVFNRTRNGIELISPLDFDKAAALWESLNLPIRLRRFKSGLLVVQDKNRTDENTIASLLSWLRQNKTSEDDWIHQTFGTGATAQEAAEHFGWSVGVATEELEMAEDAGALCRDQCIDGIRFWENFMMQEPQKPAEMPIRGVVATR